MWLSIVFLLTLRYIPLVYALCALNTSDRKLSKINFLTKQKRKDGNLSRIFLQCFKLTFKFVCYIEIFRKNSRS